MNYKKFFRSRQLRLKILSMLGWVPDRIMIALQYYVYTGRKLNFKNPQRFTEKLQLYKLKHRDSLMLRCTDKYEVRSVITEMGLGELLVPLIGIYRDPEEIDFASLPKQFVAKTTDGGGGNQIFVCKDKLTVDTESFYSCLLKWMSAPKFNSAGREWAYENHYPRRIIIEKYLENSSTSLDDYKFYCFNGRARFLSIDKDRYTEHTRAYYDSELNYLPEVRGNYKIVTDPPQLPDNIKKMVQIAEILSKPFPFVRVDLYNVKGKIYFGELTFYPASGYSPYSPDSFDMEMGKFFDI